MSEVLEVIVTGTTNVGYVTGKGVESKVTPRFFTLMVGEIELPRQEVG